MKKCTWPLLIVATGLFSFHFCSCSPDSDDDPVPSELSGDGMIILNEGGFQKGNASLTFIPYEAFSDEIDPQAEVSQSAYKANNDGPLGDVGHSMNLIDHHLYVVMNNSGIIRKLNPETFEEVGVLEIQGSPRYIQKISENKAYVSDLYGGFITIVNLSSFTMSGKITMRGMPEKMLVYGNEVYVANNQNRHVFVIDIANNIVIDSIDIGGFSNELQLYKGQIAALRNADPDNGVEGAIVVINTLSHSLSTVTEIDYSEKMWYSRSFAEDNIIYFLAGKAVYQFETGIITKLFEIDEYSPYNIYVKEGSIWLTDARDYQQKGRVLTYDTEGGQELEFAAGVIPNQLLFFDKP